MHWKKNVKTFQTIDRNLRIVEKDLLEEQFHMFLNKFGITKISSYLANTKQGD